MRQDYIPNNPAHYRGKVRLLVNKLDPDQGLEILDSDYFEDRTIWDIPERQRPILQGEIHDNGFMMFEESMEQILQKFQPGDVVEIVADAFIEYWSSWTDCGEEWDAACWFENEKVYKLTEQQVNESLSKEQQNEQPGTD